MAVAAHARPRERGPRVVTAIGQAAETSGGTTPFRLYGVLIVLFLAMAVLSISVGYVPLPFADLVSGLSGGSDGTAPSTAALIVQEIRLPRMLLGALVGISLGLSGAALQGLLRNPLAEPGLVGASSAAAFGAALVFYFGLSAVFSFALPTIISASLECPVHSWVGKPPLSEGQAETVSR